MNPSAIEDLFLLKCQDFKVSPDANRRKRFTELVRQRCVPPRFDVSFIGVGPETCKAIVRALSAQATGTEWTSVCVSGNDLGDDGATTFAGFLCTSAAGSVTELDLSGCDIGGSGCSALFEALAANTTVTALNLSAIPGGARNRLGSRATQKAAELLQQTQVLVRLELADSSPGPESLGQLLSAARSSQSLTWIDLSSNGITDETLVPFGACGSNTEFQGLVMANNKIGPKGASALAVTLQCSPHLRELDLSSNRLGSVGATQLVVALRGHPSLTSLRLDSNAIGTAGFTALADLYPPSGVATKVVQKSAQGQGPPEKVIQQQKLVQRPLQVLTVGSNGLEPSAGADMATFITRAPALARLDVSSNCLGDEGIVSLARALAGEGCSVRTLDVSNNQLSDKACFGISAALDTNRSLQRLNLSHNRLVGNSGCDSIAAALDRNTALGHVTLEFTSVGYRSHENLAAKLKQNRELQRSRVTERAAGKVQTLTEGTEWMTDVARRAEVARAGHLAMTEKLAEIHRDLQLVQVSTVQEKKDFEAVVVERTAQMGEVMRATANIEKMVAQVRSERDAACEELLHRLQREKEAWKAVSKRAAEAEKLLAEWLMGSRVEMSKVEASLAVQVEARESATAKVSELREAVGKLRGGSGKRTGSARPLTGSRPTTAPRHRSQLSGGDQSSSSRPDTCGSRRPVVSKVAFS